MSARNNTYSEVVKVTQTYLGPAAQRFVDRQVLSHLDKQPENLTPEDLGKLIDWMKISVSLLTEDNQLIEEYIHQLEQLTKNYQE